MPEDQKRALKQLQRYLLSLIRELEESGQCVDIKNLETDDFEIKLELIKKRKLSLVSNDD